ncbi:hypothetical protein C7M84_023187 [Penaeus vannamei]|uniref:Gustatory receptor n=1 Tax=Penaeus vannamei TaxID=6689 RepID=A0A423U4N6_PENVA|nr:hypothetical protein C7M84_023187 [Penaeus vannamei]
MASEAGTSPASCLIISLKLLRVLGLFPFTWKTHRQDIKGGLQGNLQEDYDELSKSKGLTQKAWPNQSMTRDSFPETTEGIPHSLKKSKWLMLWSGFAYVLFTLLSLSSIIVSIFDHAIYKEQLSDTLFVASMGVGSVLMFMALWLVCYMILKYQELAHVITELGALMSDTGCARRTLPLDKKVTCALVLLGISVAHDFVICLSIVVLSVTDHISLRSIVPYVLYMVAYTVQIAVVMMVVSVIFTIAEGYASALPRKLVKFLPDLSSELPSLADLRLSVTTHSQGENNAKLPENNRDSNLRSDSEILVLRKEITLAIDLTYGLQCFQRIFNDHVGLPVIIVILKSIGNITIMLFSVLSHDSYVDGHFHLVIFFASAARDAICLILLCYAPEKVTYQRDRLRQATVGLRMLAVDKAVDEEVRTVRPTLRADDPYPDFSMRQLFVIAKGQASSESSATVRKITF